MKEEKMNEFALEQLKEDKEQLAEECKLLVQKLVKEREKADKEIDKLKQERDELLTAVENILPFVLAKTSKIVNGKIVFTAEKKGQNFMVQDAWDLLSRLAGDNNDQRN